SFGGGCSGGVRDGGGTYPAGSHPWKQQLAAGQIGADALRSRPTMPAPLLESGALLLIFVAASLLWRRGSRGGLPVAACGILYSTWRFAAESWVGDHGL